VPPTRPLGGSGGDVIDAKASPGGPRLYLRRQLIDSAKAWSTAPSARCDVEDTAISQIETARRALRLASSGQTKAAFKPFRVALTEATGRGRSGLPSRRPAHRRAWACSSSTSF